MDLRNGHGQTLGAIRGARFQAQWSALRRNCVHQSWKPPVRLNMPTSASCDTPRRACKSLTAPSPPQWYPFRLLKVLRSLKSIRSFSVKKKSCRIPRAMGTSSGHMRHVRPPIWMFHCFFPLPCTSLIITTGRNLQCVQKRPLTQIMLLLLSVGCRYYLSPQRVQRPPLPLGCSM